MKWSECEKRVKLCLNFGVETRDFGRIRRGQIAMGQRSSLLLSKLVLGWYQNLVLFRRTKDSVSTSRYLEIYGINNSLSVTSRCVCYANGRCTIE